MVSTTKIAKNQKIPQPGSNEDTDAADQNNTPALTNASLFKPRPEGDDYIEPVDLGDDLQDFGEERLHPSSLADQGDDEALKPARWTMLLPDAFEEDDLDRESRALSLVAMGKPRTVQLAFGPVTYMRLTDAIEKGANASDRARDEDGYHRKQQAALGLDADNPAKLIGDRQHGSRFWLVFPCRPHGDLQQIEEAFAALDGNPTAMKTLIRLSGDAS